MYKIDDSWKAESETKQFIQYLKYQRQEALEEMHEDLNPNWSLDQIGRHVAVLHGQITVLENIIVLLTIKEED